MSFLCLSARGRVPIWPAACFTNSPAVSALARALTGWPNPPVPDEVVSTPDVPVQTEIPRLLRTIKGEVTCLFITHDIQAAATICGNFPLIHEGRAADHFPMDHLALQASPMPRCLLDSTLVFTSELDSCREDARPDSKALFTSSLFTALHRLTPMISPAACVPAGTVAPRRAGLGQGRRLVERDCPLAARPEGTTRPSDPGRGHGSGIFAILPAGHALRVPAAAADPAVTFRHVRDERLPCEDGRCARTPQRGLVPGASGDRPPRVVPRAGVRLLVFVAGYVTCDFTTLKDDAGRHAHDNIAGELLREGDRPRRKLSLSLALRPQRDMNLLSCPGFRDVARDRELSRRASRVRDADCPVSMSAPRARR